MTLLVEFDIAEPRILKDRIVASMDGTTVDSRVGTGCYIDPVTRTVMLAPLPVTDAWATTGAGNYARYSKSQYTLTTPAAWVQYGRKFNTDYYLYGLGTNETVTTTASFAANQPMYLSLYVSGTGSEKAVILECGWGTPGAPSTVSLKVRANSDVEVWKGTVKVGDYDLNSTTAGVGQRQGRSETVAQKTLDLLLIPCRRRDLLVVSNRGGGGCVHSFEDLDPSSTTNVITAAGTFFWRVPVGQPCVQFAPLKFTIGGTAYSPIIPLRYAPSVGQVFQFIPAVDFTAFGTPAAVYNLYTTAANGTVFTQNSVDKNVRLGASLSSDGSGTPFLYALDAVTPRTTTTTANAPFNVMPYLKKLTLSVPENEPTTAQIVCREPDKMTTDGLEKARIIGDRPVRITLDGIDLFRGSTGKPVVTEGVAGKDGAAEISWQARDREHLMELYSYRDTLPYDGLTFSSVALNLVTDTGISTSDVDVTTDTFALPFSPGVSLGDWKLLPQRGDTAAQWLSRLWEDYAKTWIRGWTPTLTAGVPGYKFRFRRPDTFSTTPVLNLFETTDGAATFGVASDLRSRRTIRTLRQLPEAASANEVLVVGYDPRTRNYLQAQYDDTASQTPGTLPGSRPDNWRSQVVALQLIDTSLSTQTVVNRAKDILQERATTGRELVEWESDLLVLSDTRPLWKGDVVRVYKSASAVGVGVPRGDYRILAIPSLEFIFEGGASLLSVRECTYSAVKIGPGAP